MAKRIKPPGHKPVSVGTKEKNILLNVLLDGSIECGGGVTDVCADGGHIGMLMAMHGIGGAGDGDVTGIGVGIGIGIGGDGAGGGGVGGGGDCIGIGGTGTVVGNGIYIGGGGHIGIAICTVIGLTNGTGTPC